MSDISWAGFLYGLVLYALLWGSAFFYTRSRPNTATRVVWLVITIAVGAKVVAWALLGGAA